MQRRGGEGEGGAAVNIAAARAVGALRSRVGDIDMSLIVQPTLKLMMIISASSQCRAMAVAVVATTAVVPVPAKGSSTVSPTCVEVKIIRKSSASGDCCL